MTRFLKTKFPCRYCGKPAPVVRLSHAKDACCRPCSERRVAIRAVGWADNAAYRHITKGNEADGPVRVNVDHWLRGAAEWLEGAARTSAAIDKLNPPERIRFFRGVRHRIGLARKLLQDVEPYLAEAEEELVADAGFEVVAGEGLPVDRAPPALRVVAKEDES